MDSANNECHRLAPYKIGERIGDLEVLGVTPKERGERLKIHLLCHKCNKKYYITKSMLKRNRQGCCKSCYNSCGNTSPRWKGCGEISAIKLINIKRNARLRGFEFTLNDEEIWMLFEKQNRRCAISGEPIHFGKVRYEETTASLDRIDSSKGYVEGNVQWIHKDVNLMKLDYSTDEFLYWCRLVTEANPRPTPKQEVKTDPPKPEPTTVA
jgi:hypothetical protein